MDLGALELKEKLSTRIKTAITLTIVAIAIDSFLPRWAIPIGLVVGQLFRAVQFDRFLKNLERSTTIRLGTAVGWASSLALFMIFASNPCKLLKYDAVFGYFFPFAMLSADLLVRSGSSEETKEEWRVRRDILLVHILVSAPWIYAVARFSWLSDWLSRSIISISLMLSFLGVWQPLSPGVPGQSRWARIHPYFGIQTVGFASQLLSSYCLVHLPRALQRRNCRAAQRVRREQNTVPYFQYGPLEAGYIRLLVLQQASWSFSGSVRASFIISPLHFAPEYEAISYRWEDSEKSQEILIDGDRALVTKSVLDVLLSCRSSKAPRTIWIDGLCINQRDEMEKACQVQLMNQIYSLAWRVLVFPGANWRWHLAARVLQRKGSLPALYQKIDLLEKWVQGLFKDSLITELGGEKRDQQAVDDERNAFSPRWQAVMDLIRDKYWTRVWVTQEVSVAKRVDLYLGGLYIGWDVYTSFLNRLMHPENRLLLSWAHMHNEEMDWSTGLSQHLLALTVHSALRSNTSVKNPIQNLTDNDRRKTLESLLHDTFNFGATDERDKVFSLLGIAADKNHGLVVDYTVSTESVYEAVARYLLTSPRTRSTGCLAFAGIGFSAQRKKMPSWVPDFSEKRSTLPLTQAPYVPAAVYRACGRAYAEPVIREGRVSGSVEIEGFICDSILRLTDHSLHFGNGEDQKVNTISIIHTKYAFVKATIEMIEDGLREYPSLLEIYLATYLGDALAGGYMPYYEPPELYANVFSLWFQNLADFQGVNSWKDVESNVALLKKLGELNPHQRGVTSIYDAHVAAACYGRKFGMTKEASLCTVPPMAEVGDVVFVPKGAKTPYLIRPKLWGAGENEYDLVGECFVQGIMNGEVVDLFEDGEQTVREVIVTLV